MIELLKGIRVLECAVLFNGDQTSRFMGDLGADVIKVEAPGVGDYLRDFLGQITPHNSPAHMFANRSKRSITLNLRTDEGRAVFFDLLKTADIFVDGFVAGACEKLGIGYEAQRKVKPDIIYCQCTGYGAVGPYATVPTHGMMMGALAGGMPARVGAEGLAERDPDRSGMGDGTVVGALFSAYTAISALMRRARTGEGCYIDGAGSDAVLATEWFPALYAWNDKRLTDRTSLAESGNANSAKYQVYRTKDGKFMLFCGIEHKFWDKFCRAAGREDLVAYKDTRTPVDFAHNDGKLRRELQSIFGSRTLAEWTQIAIDHDIAMGPAHAVEDIVDDPHIRAREIVYQEHHPHAGDFTTVGWPAPVRGQPFSVERHAPLLGEHTDAILAEIGYEADRIAALRTAKVI
ncbi:MAG: CaiB/BaiF CoA transferase family protein [Gammaproteobacteria bacterium]